MKSGDVASSNTSQEAYNKSAKAMERYQRAVNYLAAAQIYLKANPLLREPLRPEHIKDRLLGHWGTSPGINLVYAHLNQLILRTNASMLLITGPGHGAAANMSNMYTEGTLTEFFPEITQDLAGMEKFLRWFSWPYGFPSHLSPALPGVIHEGGELGYALSTAFGAAFDNPDLIVACLVGDGEAETGPTAGAWHSNKFLNPVTDGAVLPIVHLNGFKIANPTILGTMSDVEIESLITGYGYVARFVNNSNHLDAEMDEAVSWAYAEILRLQNSARSGKKVEKPCWPFLVLRTPKGMGCPKEMDGKMVEGCFRAHQVPVKDPKNNATHLAALEHWLRSYRPEELFDEGGRPAPDIVALCPKGDRRIAMCPHSFGGDRRIPLELPPLQDFEVNIKDLGSVHVSHMETLGKYLAEVIRCNEKNHNFRIVCPDELESNRLGEVLNVTNRQYVWPLLPGTEHTSTYGRVLEVLSEHNCEGWLQGYLLTGRHGLFPCYEAFIPIIDGMMNQYAKFLKSALETGWRKPVSSLNYLLTSEAWRQDHNGYSPPGSRLHQQRDDQERSYLPHLPASRCQLPAQHHGSLSAQHELHQSHHRRQAAHAAVALHGGGRRPLPGRRLSLALGRHELGRRSRDCACRMR